MAETAAAHRRSLDEIAESLGWSLDIAALERIAGL